MTDGITSLNFLSLIDQECWNEALVKLISCPTEACLWNDGVLPIHRVCESTNAPLKLIEALIKAYPESVRTKSYTTARLPLHSTVWGNSCHVADLVTVLLRYYQGGACVRDTEGHVPLGSYLFYNPSPTLKVVKILLDAHPDAVHTVDNENWYPLHFAAYCGNWEISHYLIELYPNALFSNTVSGRTPRDIAFGFHYKHKLHEKFCGEEEKRRVNFHGMPPSSSKMTSRKYGMNVVVNETHLTTKMRKIHTESLEDAYVVTLPL